jgi:hypothetical protein
MRKQGTDVLIQALSNPLVTRLPSFKTNAEMAEKLINRPLSNVTWETVPLAQRAVLLNQLKSTFCVTEDSVRIAMALQSLLWDGLLARDPRLPEQRRMVFEVAEYDYKRIESLEWRDEFIGGITIRGITGVGKSAAVSRFLNLIPQVIRHGKNDEAQWVEFCQLVYLKVPMSADGSRGGFLQNCLLEMDKAMSSDYFNRHQGKQWTVERLLVNVLHYLSLHRCGLLIIEEAQQNNLALSQFSREFLTFFLRLLNHCIPVVIIGNPLAFSDLDSFSQDQSRFSEYGDFRIGPVYDFRDEEWSDVWMPELWRATLLDEEDEPIEKLDELIWKYTAGFPRYVARLRRETLNVAIQMGSTRVCLDHIEIARMSPAMVGAGRLISAFVNRDWRDLEQFLDIPIAETRLRWSLLMSGQPSDIDSAVADSHVGIAAVPTEVFKGVRVKRPTAQKLPAKKRGTKLSKSTMPSRKFEPDDIRSQEYVNKLNGTPK